MSAARSQSHHSTGDGKGRTHYRHLLMMAALSFVAMYVLMYAMVNRFADVYNNINQAYMAGLMTAPMVIIELAVMRAMYRDRRLNAIVVATSLVALVACWTMIRTQAAVSNEQFLRSMIPHHGGALLMCREASIDDAEIQDLCKAIITSQQTEIDQMRGILGRLDP